MRKIIALLLVMAAIGAMSGVASAGNRSIYPSLSTPGSR